ncbi:MAG: hypothetical protein K0S96_186 [Geminicoccaceae bacterium]|nr:hypothetical protein [Geminicoccaceae bacterium]
MRTVRGLGRDALCGEPIHGERRWQVDQQDRDRGEVPCGQRQRGVEHQQRPFELGAGQLQRGRFQRFRQVQSRPAQMDRRRRHRFGLLAADQMPRHASEVTVQDGCEPAEIEPVAQAERLLQPPAMPLGQRLQERDHLAQVVGDLRRPCHRAREPRPMPPQEVQVVVEIVALVEIGHDLGRWLELDAARGKLGGQPQRKEHQAVEAAGARGAEADDVAPGGLEQHVRRLIGSALAPIVADRRLVPVAGTLGVGIAEQRDVLVRQQATLAALGEHEDLAVKILVEAQRKVRHAPAQQQLGCRQGRDHADQHERARGGCDARARRSRPPQQGPGRSRSAVTTTAAETAPCLGNAHPKARTPLTARATWRFWASRSTDRAWR